MQQPNWGAHRPWYASYYGTDPNLVNQIQAWFYQVDTDRSGQLDQNELGRALQQASVSLNAATLKRLVQTFDLDRSGQIGVNEFVCLYQFVLSIRNAFYAQDRDRSGKLDNWAEISAGLASIGFTLSPQSQMAVLGRFDTSRTGLTIDGFTEVALFLASLKSYFDFFAHLPQQTPGQPPKTNAPPGTQVPASISINFDQLVSATPYFQ